VNNREDNFKEALKTLAYCEPEKLAFYDDSGKAAIPPFVPVETPEDMRKTVPLKRQRRGYIFGMAVAAACCIVFVCTAMINFGPEPLDPAATGGNSAAQVADTAGPETDGYDESLRPGADSAGVEYDAASSSPAFPLLISGAIIFAAVFLVLFIKRRKLS